MTKIEEFNYLKKLYEEFKHDSAHVLGVSSGNIDKNFLSFHMEIRHGKQEMLIFPEILIFPIARYGFEGSSKIYRAFNDEHYKYIVKSLNLLTKEILQKSSELIEKALEDAANAAKNEAYEVLKITDENNKGEL